jgi:hypothetical protein
MDEPVDFDAIYREVFSPAISEVVTPENVPLAPYRTDQDFSSGSINQDMFEYIVYSRLAFADISGMNPNVLYEIGVRHGTQEAGTVLFRQAGHPIPFDIQSIKVFEYDRDRPGDARELVTRVVSETMRRNRLDSPVRQALRMQWGGAAAPPPTAAGSAPVTVAETGRSTEVVAGQGARVTVTVTVE